MKNLLGELTTYLNSALDVEPTARPWKATSSLPFYLLERYSFTEAEIAGTNCLLMICQRAEAPSTIKKHLRQVKELWKGPLILVRDRLTPYERRRLIADQIPFIVPHSQIYLPGLGLDLRERFAEPEQPRETLSPSAQALLLSALYSPCGELTATTLADSLGYSRMTLSRALRELEQFELGTIRKHGTERRWSPIAAGAELWERALPFLRSPVQRKMWIRESLEGPAAGLSALAQYSMLAPPTPPVLAARAADPEWHLLPYPEDAASEVEIWSYDPGLFAENGVVDRLSLFLSLRGTQDERVEAALDEMMEAIQWEEPMVSI